MQGGRLLEGGPSLDRLQLAWQRARPSLSRRAQLVLAYLLALGPALAFAVFQPVWSRVDEAQHADVLAQYSHGTYPVAGLTTLRPEIVDVMRETGVYQWGLPGTQPDPAVTDPTRFTPAPSGLPPAGYKVWMRRHLWWFSYEAIQPPLFYVLATPVWSLGSAFGGTWTAILAVRLLNACLLALLAPIALAVTRQLSGRAAPAALLASVAVAVLPGVLLNGTAITNDTLAAVLGGLLTLVLVAGLTRGWSRRRAVGAGLLLGAAVLTKLTAVGLALPLATALAWPVFRDRGAAARQLRRGGLALAMAAAAVLPWLLLNERLYGVPLPTAAARALLQPTFGPPRLRADYVTATAANTWLTFWTGEPLDTLPLVLPEVAAGAALCALAAVGAVYAWRARRGREGRSRPAVPPLLAGLAVAGVAASAGSALYLSGIGGLLPGRYLYPALVPAVALLAAGLYALPARWGAVRLAAFGVYGLVSVANIAGSLTGLSGVHLDERPPSPGSVTVPVSGQAGAGGLRVVVDQMTVDRSASNLWLHLAVQNGGEDGATWWPIPYVALADGRRIGADYAGSTQFSGEVAPGGEEAGWIKFGGVPPDGVQEHPFEVVFSDVTTDGYQSVDKIVLILAPPSLADAGSGAQAGPLPSGKGERTQEGCALVRLDP